MINAIVVDDEPLGRDMMARLIEDYCPGVNLVAECSSVSSALQAINEKNPDLVFLDIAMPGGDGFELLKAFDTITFEVIFVTAHDQHILKALRCNAIDYLLKPINEKELMTAVQKVVKNQAQRQEKENIKHLVAQHFSSGFKKTDSLCIPDSRGFQFVKLEDIICCEASNTYTVIHLPGNQQRVSTKPLMEYEALLADSGFARVHKSWLINMQHVKEYLRGDGGTVVLTNNKTVDVAKRKKEYFLSELKKVAKF